MTQPYRCKKCRRLLFTGSLKLLLAKRHDRADNFIERICDRCGTLNRFTYDPHQEVQKDTSPL